MYKMFYILIAPVYVKHLIHFTSHHTQRKNEVMATIEKYLWMKLGLTIFGIAFSLLLQQLMTLDEAEVSTASLVTLLPNAMTFIVGIPELPIQWHRSKCKNLGLTAEDERDVAITHAGERWGGLAALILLVSGVYYLVFASWMTIWNLPTMNTLNLLDLTYIVSGLLAVYMLVSTVVSIARYRS